VPVAPAAPAPLAAEPESALAHVIEAAPIPAPIVEPTPAVEPTSIVESTPAVEPTPIVSAEPVASAATAPVEAASAVTEVGHRPAATEVAAAPARRANGLSTADLQPMLESAGLVWVRTDEDKLRAAQEAAAQTPAPVRVPRERKPLAPVDPTPMQQVETRKDA
jgi:ribonuclease E